MFLSTVIVATVTLIEPFDVMRRPLIRDLLFFLGAVIFTFFVLYHQEVDLWQALGQFLVFS